MTGRRLLRYEREAIDALHGIGGIARIYGMRVIPGGWGLWAGDA